MGWTDGFSMTVVTPEAENRKSRKQDEALHEQRNN
jgi:hypothetical protein